jgi:surface antigen
MTRKRNLVFFPVDDSGPMIEALEKRDLFAADIVMGRDTIFVSDRTVNPGQEIIVSVRRDNIGTSADRGSKTAIMLSTNLSITRSDTVLAKSRTVSLQAGRSLWETFRIRIPNNVIPGLPYIIGAIGDFDNQTRERSESNNNDARGVQIAVNRADKLPPTGRASSYAGVRLDDKQCVGSARDLSVKLNGRGFPALGADGGPADLWRMTAVAGFTKVSYQAGRTPPANALLIWKPTAANGNYGHIAIVLGTTSSGKIRVVDSNWYKDERGWIRDVSLSSSLHGWFVPK